MYTDMAKIIPLFFFHAMIWIYLDFSLPLEFLLIASDLRESLCPHTSLHGS